MGQSICLEETTWLDETSLAIYNLIKKVELVMYTFFIFIIVIFMLLAI